MALSSERLQVNGVRIRMLYTKGIDYTALGGIQTKSESSEKHIPLYIHRVRLYFWNRFPDIIRNLFLFRTLSGASIINPKPKSYLPVWNITRLHG